MTLTQYDMYRRIRNQVEQRPYHKDRQDGRGQCFYFYPPTDADPEQEPKCIFGCALADIPTAKRILVRADVIQDKELGGVTEDPYGSILTILPKIEPESEEWEQTFINWCEAIQKYQDGGQTWKDSWDRAYDELMEWTHSGDRSWWEEYDKRYKEENA